jgi:hypothetical protein
MAKLVKDAAVDRRLPEPIPDDAQGLLELIDDAATWAAGAQPGSYRFEHGMRLFKAASAHYDLVVSRELAQAHHDLKSATTALNVSTVALAVVTVILVGVEVWKALCH